MMKLRSDLPPLIRVCAIADPTYEQTLFESVRILKRYGILLYIVGWPAGKMSPEEGGDLTPGDATGNER